jgi:hypothetical protein
MRILHPSLTLLSLALGVTLGGAASITYNVNFTVGPASVTGDIVTDGTIGNLVDPSFSDGVHIINWNLLLNDPTTLTKPPFTPCDGPPCTFDLFGPPGIGAFGGHLVSANGNDLSATATQLLFNFSGTDGGYFLFETGASAAVCFETTASNCISFQYGAGESLYINSASVQYNHCPDNSGSYDCRYSSLTGSQVIGTAAGSSAPEPSTLALLGAGIAVLGFRQKTRHCGGSRPTTVGRHSPLRGRWAPTLGIATVGHR